MRMTSMVNNTSNSEVTTPTSYVSRWIAQSHNVYQKKTNEFYSPSSSSTSSDFQTPIGSCKPSPIKTTTWQAQAKSRLDAAAIATQNSLITSSINNNNNNNELQEKLHRVR